MFQIFSSIDLLDGRKDVANRPGPFLLLNYHKGEITKFFFIINLANRINISRKCRLLTVVNFAAQYRG